MRTGAALLIVRQRAFLQPVGERWVLAVEQRYIMIGHQQGRGRNWHYLAQGTRRFRSLASAFGFCSGASNAALNRRICSLVKTKRVRSANTLSARLSDASSIKLERLSCNSSAARSIKLFLADGTRILMVSLATAEVTALYSISVDTLYTRGYVYAMYRQLRTIVPLTVLKTFTPSRDCRARARRQRRRARMRVLRRLLARCRECGCGRVPAS